MDSNDLKQSTSLSRSSRSSQPAQLRCTQIHQGSNRTNGSRQIITANSNYSHIPQPQLDRINARNNTRYHMSNSFDWKHLPQVEIKLVQIPAKFTTWDVYRLLDGFGNIVRIHLLDAVKYGTKAAFVTFRPVPDTAFWEVDSMPGGIVAILPLHNKTIATIQDPLNKGAQLPVHLHCDAQSLECGYMVSENCVMTMFSSGTQTVRFAMDLNKRIINIDFYVSAPGKNGAHDLGCHRLQLKLDKLLAAYFEHDDAYEILTISVEFPPELYRKSSEINITHQSDSKIWTEWDAMRRQTDVVLPESVIRQRPTGIRKDEAIIDIGRWRTYRVAFKHLDDANNRLERIKRALSSYNVQISEKNFEILSREDPASWDMLDPPEAEKIQGGLGYSSLLQATMTQRFFHLSFETRYQLEVCLSHGWLHEANFTENFLHKLQELDSNDRYRAVGILERVAALKRRFFDVMEIFQLQVTFTEVAGTRKPPRHCTIARSAIITPTMVYFNTPAVEISNRVIREWSTYSDRFLRVRFSDELCYGQLMLQDGNRYDEIYAKIRQVLRKGIILGDRKYEFLAFGNSQFRERGAYFFAPTKGVSCESIREQLGQMSEKDQFQPAKFCARLGQNFSTTRGLAVRVTMRTHKQGNNNDLVLPDIKRNGYVFTDGVGKISQFLAKMIAGEFVLPTEDAPSVFQFRLGGCKGVLAVDPKLSSHEVHLRPSQYKFAAIHEGLEIIRVSKFASASLNRQLITVLSALGVPDDVFVQKMKDQLQALEMALVDERVASEELQKVVDMNQTTLNLASMVHAGFMATKEPFMMSMLRLWRSWSLKNLKEKAKVSIEKGAFLFGTVDETATLRGHFNSSQSDETMTLEEKMNNLPEVFCYTDRKRKGVYEVVQGLCILARNPSLHPGDIRVVRAVDVPHLYHIKNAIVFPQTGDRDISNMCSGGDLDGDDYVLIWDLDLIPKEWNHPPMDFTPAKPLSLDRKVTENDMTDFFVDYMKSDILALIATRHLALADYAEEGVKDQRCKRLAQLHSFAVDYPKSGVPVNMPPQLKKGVKWPHFMEKHKTDYVSTKILGQLYDLVVKEDFHPENSTTFDKRILDAFENDEVLLKKAAAIKCRYDSRLKKIMAQHDIATEFEVWSAFVMKHNNDKKDYTFSEELGTLMEAIRAGFKEECEEEAGGRDPTYLHPFVAAMYVVTARQAQEAAARLANENTGDDSAIAVSDTKVPFISFPWLFLQDLSKIAQGGAYNQENVHRVQGPQRRHNTKPTAADEEHQGDIETSEGILPRGELFKPFEDQRTNLDEDGEDCTTEVDGHASMIDNNIGGRIPDRPKTGRDVKIEALQAQHKSISMAVEAKSLSHEAVDVAYIRSECPVETHAMSDYNIRLWITDSDKANELLPHEPYQDLLGPLDSATNLHATVNETGSASLLGHDSQIQDGSMNSNVQVTLDLDDSDSEVDNVGEPESVAERSLSVD